MSAVPLKPLHRNYPAAQHALHVTPLARESRLHYSQHGRSVRSPKRLGRRRTQREVVRTFGCEKREGQLGNERFEVIRHMFRDALTAVFPWWSLTSRDKGWRTRQTLQPLAWHWSHLPGRLVNRGRGGVSLQEKGPVWRVPEK